MERPTSPSQWSEHPVEGNHSPANYTPTESARPFALQQPAAGPVPQLMPTIPSNRPQLYPSQDPNPAIWWSMSGPSALPLDLHQVPTTEWLLDQPMQEPANWNPALLSTMTSHTSCQRPGSETNHLVIPAVEHDAPGFPCKWQDCRSTTCFRREVDLMRHVKSVHVAPKAYCCLEPNCGKAFGRKDHLQNHKRNRHPDNH